MLLTVLLHLDLTIGELLLSIASFLRPHHDRGSLWCETPRGLNNQWLLLVNAEALSIHVMASLDEILGDDDLLSLVLVVRVDCALPSVCLQLQLIELLLGVPQGDRGLTLHDHVMLSILTSRHVLRAGSTVNRLTFLLFLVQNDVVRVIRGGLRDDLVLINVEVVDYVRNVGHVRAGLGRVRLHIQKLLLLLDCDGALVLGTILPSFYMTRLVPGMMGLIMGRRIYLFRFLLDPSVDQGLFLFVSLSVLGIVCRFRKLRSC